MKKIQQIANRVIWILLCIASVFLTSYVILAMIIAPVEAGLFVPYAQEVFFVHTATAIAATTVAIGYLVFTKIYNTLKSWIFSKIIEDIRDFLIGSILLWTIVVICARILPRLWEYFPQFATSTLVEFLSLSTLAIYAVVLEATLIGAFSFVYTMPPLFVRAEID